MFNNIKHRMWKKCLTPVMNKLGKNNLLLEQTRFGVYVNQDCFQFSCTIFFRRSRWLLLRHKLMIYLGTLNHYMIIYKSSHSNYLEPVQLDIVNIITSLFTCKVWPYRTPIRVNVINSKAAEL